MSKKEPRTKELIREYLLNEGLLREKLPDPQSKLEFGFIFSFPPGQETQRMSVFKPKDKNFIIIILRTQISESHVNSLKTGKNDKISSFLSDLRKYFIIKEVYFRIDIQNFRYEISDQLYLEKSGYISKNLFFNSIRKLFYSYMYSNIILEEKLSGKLKISDKNISKFDLSLYS